MANHITVHMAWTKEGDGAPGRRLSVASIALPVKTQLDALGKALAAIPGEGDLYYLVPEVQTTEYLSQDTALAAIAKVAEIERLARDAEQRIAEKDRADRIERLMRWTQGGPRPESLMYPTGVLMYDTEKLVQSMPESQRLTFEAFLEAYKDEYEEKRIAESAADDIRSQRRQEEAARKKQEKEDRDAAQHAEIVAWAAAHGSDRLKKQIDLGYDGWPLYLHERIARDFPGMRVALANDQDGDFTSVQDPEELDLEYEIEVRKHLKALNMVPDTLISEGEDGGTWIRVEGYRPGVAFNLYTLRVEVLR